MNEVLYLIWLKVCIIENASVIVDYNGIIADLGSTEEIEKKYNILVMLDIKIVNMMKI